MCSTCPQILLSTEIKLSAKTNSLNETNQINQFIFTKYYLLWRRMFWKTWTFPLYTNRWSVYELIAIHPNSIPFTKETIQFPDFTENVSKIQFCSHFFFPNHFKNEEFYEWLVTVLTESMFIQWKLNLHLILQHENIQRWNLKH